MESSGLYIQLFSIHGLIRGESPELGRDADTGGQVKYVLELAKVLGEHSAVAQVDLVTRFIEEKRVSPSYANEIENLTDNVRIVRIQCGTRKYIRKELLWPHLDEFVDNTIKFYKNRQRIPDVFHGHYADGGYVAMNLAETFGGHFIFTGHSLGRNKKKNLFADGVSEKKIEKRYKIGNRIRVEEDIIQNAQLIITSTHQEIEKQYGLYENFSKASYHVIPPGIDLDIFHPYYDYELAPDKISPAAKQTRIALLKELHRFWKTPAKPFILALCRPDRRKNISGLLEAYGNNKELQAMANLAIFAGIRKNIKEMEDNERNVLNEMLLQMDQYDLYGKLAIPKKHDFASEVPELYKICAESGGVFVNPALVEPFGLTLIEASACGLPIVATHDGGPVDIIGNCENGILVNPFDSEEIAKALTDILAAPDRWNLFSDNGINGVNRNYSWHAHCERMIEHLSPLFSAEKMGIKKKSAYGRKPSHGKRLTKVQKILITDIDNTLVGEAESLEKLLTILERNEEKLAWGVSTGRSLEMTLESMTEHSIPIPDVLICSVGSEIYYGPHLRIDKGWQQHLTKQWKPETVQQVLGSLHFLHLQEQEAQRHFYVGLICQAFSLFSYYFLARIP